jgi:hypothetical protein
VAKKMKAALLFPVVSVKSLPARQKCGRDWARLVGPRRGTQAAVFQACPSYAAAGMDLARASVFAVEREPGVFIRLMGGRR